MATTYTVSSSAELQTVLSKATGGDVIKLASGNYGSVDFHNLNFNSYVTITSANGADGAVFQDIGVYDSSYLRINGVHVSSPSNGTSTSKLVAIENSSYVQFLNSEVNGKIDSVYTGHYGIYTAKTDHVTISGNNVHDVKVGGVFYTSTQFKVSGNTIDNTGSDGLKFIGVRDFLIENNRHGGIFHPQEGAHLDFIQFQGTPSSDGVIRGNVFLAESHANVQGIFLADVAFDNILIEENIIYTGMANGIKVGIYGTNITARYNTVLNAPDTVHKATIISLPSGSVNEHNIVSGTSGGTSGSNIIVQYDDPKDINYYDKLFVNATAGLGITLEDLRPITGSLAETKGAYARLMDLLDGVSEPTVTPTPEPTPEPTPTPEPAPDTGEDDALISPAPVTPVQPVYSLLGDTEFTGLKQSIVTTAHDKSMETSEGSIAFSFDADNVKNMAGLISKDASYYDGGGNHFSIWIRNGTLHVRFQDEDSDSFFAVSGIKANQEYDVLATFDEDDVSLYLDGKLIGTKDFTMDWTANHQYLQVGGLGWGSDSGSSAATNAFDGTISDVMIFDEAMTPQDYNFFA